MLSYQLGAQLFQTLLMIIPLHSFIHSTNIYESLCCVRCYTSPLKVLGMTIYFYSSLGYFEIKIFHQFTDTSWDFPDGSDGKASVYDVGHPDLISGLGRSPGEGNDNPLQYSCLENPGRMEDPGRLHTVHGAAKS